MKKCPSCSAQCETAAQVCAVCGYAFEDVGGPKRTMMGFPSLAAALEEAEASAPEEPAKQTLFGFPAQKALGGGPSEAEDHEEEEEVGATSIIPASAFAFDSGSISVPAVPDDDDDDEDARAPTMEKDLRGTVAGMPLKPRDIYSDDATEIVSGTAVFPGIRPAADDEDEDDIRQQGTLMGMSLADVQATAPQPSSRSTQFAIPAVQAEKMQEHTAKLETTNLETSKLDSTTDKYDPRTSKIDGLDEASEDQIDDSPTQAWAPGTLLSKDSDSDGRKKLLEKIRKSRPVSDPATPLATRRDSGGDGPDLSALKKLKPKRDLHATPAEFPSEDERDTNEQPSAPGPSHQTSTPAAGVIRGTKPKRPSDTGSLRPPTGASGYSFGPGERSDEQLGESISDPEFGLMETDIASGEVLDQAVKNLAKRGIAVEDAPPPTPLRTTGKGVFETFDGGAGSQPSSNPPASPRTVPTQLPTQPSQPEQRQQQPSQPYVPPTSQPQQPQQPQRPAAPQSRPYQPESAPAPYVPPASGGPPAVAPVDEKLVRYFQSAFGLAAGVVTLIVQVVVVTTAGLPAGLFGISVIALGATLAVAAIAASIFPLSGRIRSFAFFGLAVGLALCFVLGVIAAVPKTFLVIGFGALLAAVAGAFPHLTRLVT